MISGADVYPSSIIQTSQISNHYEVPNLSSMLYEYTNSEMDRIRYSFRVGNFYSLRDLPRHLLPGNVSQISRSKIDTNLYSQIQEKSYIELTNGGGFFSKFQYVEDPFENFLEAKRQERLEHEEKMKDVHKGATFKSHPKVEAKFKH